jgi:DNA polymerase-1
MLVGEAPGETELRTGVPFSGASGDELSRILHEAGFIRSELYITNVCKWRPPDNKIDEWVATTKKPPTGFVSLFDKWVHPYIKQGYEQLEREIALVRPKLILAVGNTALWALTGKSGITSWRGSQLTTRDGRIRVVPTYHPAAVLRQWDWRAIMVWDLKRAREWHQGLHPVPEWKFIVRPTYEQTVGTLNWLLQELSQGPVHLAVDLETRAGHIACIGLAWSSKQAICIPFMCVERDSGYWPLGEEQEIILLLRRVLTHPGCFCIGQNFLYDAQYTTRRWGFIPNLQWDTMVQWHVRYPALPKALYFIASMLCDHYIYWKDDGKEWDPSVGEEQLWIYNCTDAVRTWEIAQIQFEQFKDSPLAGASAFQQSLFHPVLRMMLRGIRVDHSLKPQLSHELEEAQKEALSYLHQSVGFELNPGSPKQMQTFFYEDLRIPPILHRKTKKPTLDDEALTKIGDKHIWLRPVVGTIADYRSLKVFKSTFIDSETDFDGRMRCSFNPAGTDSFRFSSSQNAFGSGMNFQNLPKEGSKSANKAKLRGSKVRLPNIRNLFIPDPGFEFWDADLDRADLQVVVWEADDQPLKLALREGLDLHLLNARDLFGLPYSRDDLRDPGITKQLKERFKPQREFAKTFVHGTNYGGRPRTMSEHARCTVSEAEAMQRAWFRAHPGIKEWHERTEMLLQTERCVWNKFGYRMYFFDRVEGLLPEALAWVPQSTVACIINRGLASISRNLPQVHLLLQVHDSLAGQKPIGQFNEAICEQMRIEVPYKDPLVIPVSIQTSAKSWGDCSGG